MPSIQPIDQRVQQEAGEPQGVGRAALRTLQLRADSSDAALYARYAAGVTDRLWSVEELIEEANR
jgi:hypothetical protein